MSGQLPSGANLCAFFDDLAARWDAMQSPERDARLVRLLEPHRALFGGAQTVLDIGSGTGVFLPHLARLAAQASIVALDLSREMLRRAKANGRTPVGYGLVRGDGLRLPLRSSCVDMVTCHNSFAHFDDRAAALREIRRVLRPGGRLFILHDLGRERVNAIHSAAPDPRIRTHLLSPVEQVAPVVKASGFEVVTLADDDEHYLIAAQAV